MGGRWNLGGQKASLMVEDPDTGRLGAWSCQEDVHKLCAALDRRGERELALLTEISKVCFGHWSSLKAVSPWLGQYSCGV